MDCLHDRCGSFSNRCPSVSRYAPCYKTPSLPGCDMVAGDEMLKCGLGLACDRRLFNFIKDEFSPCTGCLAGCSQCRDCIHCIDHPEDEGCDMVAGDEMLKCGLGLACDRRLFNFIKDEFS